MSPEFRLRPSLSALDWRQNLPHGVWCRRSFRPSLSDRVLSHAPDARHPVSPEFRLRPSLSGASVRAGSPRGREVSPEFRLRPSLSDVADERLHTAVKSVAGVQAPAFVERRIRCLGTDQVCAELQGRTKDEAHLSLASAIELILVQSCDRCRGSRPPPRRSPESPGTEDPPGAVHTGHRRLTGPRPSRSPWSATGDVPEFTLCRVFERARAAGRPGSPACGSPRGEGGTGRWSVPIR